MAIFFISQPILTAWAETDQNETTSSTREEEIAELNRRIETRRKDINALQQEIDAYNQQISTKQKEAKSLRNQIAILDNQVAKINLDIEATEARIEETNLEIQSLNLQIQDLENLIADRKQKISEYLRLIYKTDQISYFEILLVNESFSDFFDQTKYTEEIHNNLSAALVKLKNHKQNLGVQKSNWEEKAKLEEKLKDQLQEEKSELTEKSTAQGVLLLQARLTEKQYQNFKYQLQLEQQQINSEIVTLEKNVREQLEARDAAERFKGFGPAQLAWPIIPVKGVSAYFHDPDYPFRYIFEHPAIDIRAGQGTTIQAPESGYVARVQFRGDSSYAYIMLIHNDGLSTVFGHISQPLVKEDEYVNKGQAIALSGGMPGGTGSGNLSTGPHLHFEVRLNGIPVNPLEYLPPF
ncbi:MAG: peptidoglycan DD-metalloendopeptidase family protein [Patescibacteria group bacterium]